jgi:hypothetical protein
MPFSAIQARLAVSAATQSASYFVISVSLIPRGNAHMRPSAVDFLGLR